MTVVDITVKGLVLNDSKSGIFYNTMLAVQLINIHSDHAELQPFNGDYLVKLPAVYEKEDSVRLELSSVKEAKDTEYKRLVMANKKQQYVTVVCDHTSLSVKEKEKWHYPNGSEGGKQLMLKVQPDPKKGKSEPKSVTLFDEGPEGEKPPLRKASCYQHYKQQCDDNTPILTVEEVDTLLHNVLFTASRIEE